MNVSCFRLSTGIKILRTLLMLTLPAFVAGCLEMEQDLVLNRDGSGTLKVEYEISEQTATRMRNMIKLSDELAAAAGKEAPPIPDDDYTQLLFNPSEALIRKKIESYKANGIELVKLDYKAQSALRTVSFQVKFKDIGEVAKADFFESYGFSLVKSQNGNYVIYTRPAMSDEFVSTWDFSDTKVKRMVSPFLQDFSFKLGIKVPGDVLKTNAHRRSGRDLQWVYEFDSDPYAITKLQRDQFTIVFKSNEATLPEIRQVPKRAAAPTKRKP